MKDCLRKSIELSKNRVIKKTYNLIANLIYDINIKIIIIQNKIKKNFYFDSDLFMQIKQYILQVGIYKDRITVLFIKTNLYLCHLFLMHDEKGFCNQNKY